MINGVKQFGILSFWFAKLIASFMTWFTFTTKSNRVAHVLAACNMTRFLWLENRANGYKGNNKSHDTGQKAKVCIYSYTAPEQLPSPELCNPQGRS